MPVQGQGQQQRQGRRKITVKNASGQTIRVKGEVIKNNEERSLGRFEVRENHKIDINDEHGKDLLVQQIHLQRRAKHLIFSKSPEGKFCLCKQDKNGNAKHNANLDADEPDDFVDEEDKADEREDEQSGTAAGSQTMQGQQMQGQQMQGQMGGQGKQQPMMQGQQHQMPGQQQQPMMQGQQQPMQGQQQPKQGQQQQMPGQQQQPQGQQQQPMQGQQQTSAAQKQAEQQRMQQQQQQAQPPSAGTAPS